MNVVREDLLVTAAGILEDWAMMMVDRSETVIEQFDYDLPFYRSSISFQGVVNGSYFIVCQEAFARTLAANLLGSEIETNESVTNDALKEMINVISGNLLTMSFGEDTVFDLSVPQVDKITPDEVRKFDVKQTISFVADCEPVLISFEVRDAY